MRTMEFEVFRNPQEGREGGVRLVTMRISDVTTIEDTGDSDSCLIVLTNGREYTANMAYLDVLERLKAKD